MSKHHVHKKYYIMDYALVAMQKTYGIV